MTVKRQVPDFERGRFSITDQENEGRPKCVTFLKIIDKVQDMVLKEHRLRIDEINEVFRYKNAFGKVVDALPNLRTETNSSQTFSNKFVPFTTGQN